MDENKAVLSPLANPGKHVPEAKSLVDMLVEGPSFYTCAEKENLYDLLITIVLENRILNNHPFTKMPCTSMQKTFGESLGQYLELDERQLSTAVQLLKSKIQQTKLFFHFTLFLPYAIYAFPTLNDIDPSKKLETRHIIFRNPVSLKIEF